MKKCIFTYKNIYYLSLISEYIEDGDIDDTDIDDTVGSLLIKLFDEKEDSWYSTNLSQLLFYFLKLCNNGHVKISKSVVEKALKACKNEKCQEMLNGYISKANYN